jgi:hypothetical protein
VSMDDGPCLNWNAGYRDEPHSTLIYMSHITPMMPSRFRKGSAGTMLERAIRVRWFQISVLGFLSTWELRRGKTIALGRRLSSC